jgi:vacuolar-type H+-ATPase subunit H
MTLERRTQALLDLVEGDRRSQCEAILAEARERASALLAQAHADARARMRGVFTEERRRANELKAAAFAKLQTRRRLHEQQRATALLALGWQRLPDALRHRWNDSNTRSIWVDAIVAMATRVLPRTQWGIHHGPDWPVVEQQATGARVSPDLEATPTFIADAGIVAGLRITSGGNVVDGTLAGLIADRVDVGAQLLRHLEQAP